MLIEVTNVITRAQFESIRNELAPQRAIDPRLLLANAGVPRLVADRALGLSLDEGPEGWCWIRNSDSDEAAALVAARILAIAVKYKAKASYTSSSSIIENWDAAPKFGPGSKIEAILPLRTVQVLGVSGIGTSGSSREAAILLSILEHRWLNQLPTVLGSAYNSKDLRTRLTTAGCPGTDVESLIRLIAKAVN